MQVITSVLLTILVENMEHKTSGAAPIEQQNSSRRPHDENRNFAFATNFYSFLPNKRIQLKIRLATPARSTPRARLSRRYGTRAGRSKRCDCRAKSSESTFGLLTSGAGSGAGTCDVIAQNDDTQILVAVEP